MSKKQGMLMLKRVINHCYIVLFIAKMKADLHVTQYRTIVLVCGDYMSCMMVTVSLPSEYTIP